MSEPSHLTDAEEVEFKLAVVADPAETFDYVARLEQLAGERLGPPTRHTIHDLYWDTADRSLGARRLTLRLRDIDGQLKLTAKWVSS